MTDESSRAAALPAKPHRQYRLLALVGIYFVIAHVFSPPEGIDPQDWRRVGVFFATIGGLMLQPMPGSPMVIVGIVAMLVLGGLPMDQALVGYSSSSVWMVLMAVRLPKSLKMI